MNVYESLLAKAINGGGGGGSSDFSTAQIAVTSVTAVNAIIPIIYESDDYDLSTGDAYIETGYNEFKAILYKGACYIYLPPTETATETVVISGDILDDGDGYYWVTGDCMIDINNGATHD